MSQTNMYNYLFDLVSPPQKVEILSESRCEETGEPKVVFKARLQTADEKNQNGRVYSMAICESITNQLKDKAINRSLLMEVDHPMVATNDASIMKRRATTIEYKSAGCLLRNIYMSGSDIIGEIETLSGFNGPDIAKIVLYDKVNIGFSLRALGGVDKRPDGTIVVLAPIKPITYDVVTNPSHAKARVLEFLPESVSSFDDSDNMVMCESSDDMLVLEQDRVNLLNTNILEKNFIDEILKENFERSLKSVKFKF